MPTGYPPYRYGRAATLADRGTPSPSGGGTGAEDDSGSDDSTFGLDEIDEEEYFSSRHFVDGAYGREAPPEPTEDGMPRRGKRDVANVYPHLDPRALSESTQHLLQYGYVVLPAAGLRARAAPAGAGAGAGDPSLPTDEEIAAVQTKFDDALRGLTELRPEYIQTALGRADESGVKSDTGLDDARGIADKSTRHELAYPSADHGEFIRTMRKVALDAVRTPLEDLQRVLAGNVPADAGAGAEVRVACLPGGMVFRDRSSAVNRQDRLRVLHRSVGVDMSTTVTLGGWVNVGSATQTFRCVPKSHLDDPSAPGFANASAMDEKYALGTKAYARVAALAGLLEDNNAESPSQRAMNAILAGYAKYSDENANAARDTYADVRAEREAEVSARMATYAEREKALADAKEDVDRAQDAVDRAATRDNVAEASLALVQATTDKSAAEVQFEQVSHDASRNLMDVADLASARGKLANDRYVQQYHASIDKLMTDVLVPPGHVLCHVEHILQQLERTPIERAERRVRVGWRLHRAEAEADADADADAEADAEADADADADKTYENEYAARLENVSGEYAKLDSFARTHANYSAFTLYPSAWWSERSTLRGYLFGKMALRAELRTLMETHTFKDGTNLESASEETMRQMYAVRAKIATLGASAGRTLDAMLDDFQRDVKIVESNMDDRIIRTARNVRPPKRPVPGVAAQAVAMRINMPDRFVYSDADRAILTPQAAIPPLDTSSFF
jgi:hypothetical protein